MYLTQSVMMDVKGVQLCADEKEMLQHPLVGGVILFSRNFESSKQLIALNKAIREAAKRPILIATDHEGGRVQRFRTDEFTHLPAMGVLYQYHRQTEQLEDLKSHTALLGQLMASECLAHGIDLSFAPVLDLDNGSDVIGDRGFHHDVHLVSQLATAWCQGVLNSKMKTVGKHFPGHGSVKEDSHIAAPVDQRSLTEIAKTDMLVFCHLIEQRLLQGMMPAHVKFPQVDDNPVGYSRKWLQQILKGQLGFNGVLFSDDLSMVGAGKHLSYSERAKLALNAGCDMVLACNNQEGVCDILDNLSYSSSIEFCKSHSFIVPHKISLKELHQMPGWRKGQKLAQEIRQRMT